MGRVLRFDLHVAGDAVPRCFRRLVAGIPAGLVRQSSHRLLPAEAANFRAQLLVHWHLKPHHLGDTAGIILVNRRESRRLLDADKTAREVAKLLDLKVSIWQLEDLSLRQQATLLTGSRAIVGVCGQRWPMQFSYRAAPACASSSFASVGSTPTWQRPS